MGHVIEYQAQCTCGWKGEPRPSAKEAQCDGLRHETQKIRRSYQHDADAITVIR
jgi:hypothetical protein